MQSRLIFLYVFAVSLSSCNTAKTAMQYDSNKQSNEYKQITTLKYDDSTKNFTALERTEVVFPEKIENKCGVVFVEENSLAQEIVDLAKEFIGIRYRAGGTSAGGMDCSGMVFSTFKKKEITVPRSSGALAYYGKKITKSEAKPGDLIFFRTNGRKSINHVGIITEVTVDDIKFVHASVHRGVIISSLSEAYYTRTFAQINKVIE